MSHKINGKIYVSANELLLDSYRLGKQIIESGFKPDFMVGVWRGGTPPAIAVHELLNIKGIKADHTPIYTSGFDDDDKPKDEIEVFALEYLIKKANSNSKLLIVEDVLDSGLSYQAILKTLSQEMRANLPEVIKFASVYYKPDANKTKLKPDYFIHTCGKDEWIVFPHELKNLKKEEIGYKGGQIAEIVNSIVVP